MEKNILKKYKSFFNFVTNIKNNTEKENSIKYAQNIYLSKISKSNYNVKSNEDQIYDNKLFLKYWIRKKRPGARN
ncbi:conserved Plasmodium protein, unknown function [Plasmodium reichenowi]|uniref:Uncharacterized protein n=16 Tax=Plasmodium (Laverania) TaxID=418107 RepID=Q8IEC1_PLAF7|nr:conserved protein, unknown function [Plasmodium falciparum 3D7]XP_012764575.1 hypothetical protein PRSY57_1318500 [Plasmodium reichenowi]ETW17218.1 hypothetical protein PFFVO_04043 [Plasmodium falciparum Vietnam Oak-Knoll (FVO)]ETW29527.1 hypothetical protein PFFCH_03001 [Plasmodium falciparum FCH/4]ETW34873.1 hypothetical protein PFTANZ_04406 [Plasmodium falciparum Tanzania (2000708)]ETW40970.1 hypothetical protein PFNF135_04607 [Plasmodium falciparum NF135/5.C10]ETW47606.1 hypothetical p|eukprot:XP_001349931.1 conserved Plasmodium protein, unknown function [Plasmodium falciparum 3D7]